MNYLTTSELMIGDLVNVHRRECVADDGHYVEWDEYGMVVGITEYYITIKYIGREDDYSLEEAEEKDINPIPLTPEILEKNGFVRQFYHGWLISENDGRKLIEYCTDYFDGILRIKYTEEPFCDISLKIKYVHELQHTLHLCKINKNIEL